MDTSPPQARPAAQSSVPVYRFRIAGHLDPAWSAWFDGLSVAPLDDGNTELCGPVVDQAALHGVLQKIRDLNLVLLSVRQQEE